MDGNQDDTQFMFTADDLVGVLIRESQKMTAYLLATGLAADWIGTGVHIDRMADIARRVRVMVESAAQQHAAAEASSAQAH